MKKIILALSVILVGCTAKQSKITPIGGGIYFISSEAPSAFHGMGRMKANLLKRASKHCNGHAVITSIHESQPPYIAGNFPRVEIQFRCE